MCAATAGERDEKCAQHSPIWHSYGNYDIALSVARCITNFYYSFWSMLGSSLLLPPPLPAGFHLSQREGALCLRQSLHSFGFSLARSLCIHVMPSDHPTGARRMRPSLDASIFICRNSIFISNTSSDDCVLCFGKMHTMPCMCRARSEAKSR